MELIRGMHNLRARHRGCVVTIGNFDGVHLGHEAVFSQLAAIGKQARLPSVLVTFEPQPQEFFAGANAPSRLTRFTEKMCALAGAPVDRVVVLRFDRCLASMPAGDFIEKFLVAGLGAKLIVAGEDFRFGRDAFGNLALLESYGKRHDFMVVKRETYCARGARVSSSWIRDALANGELELASALLGRTYAMAGRVIRGRQLGRRIGYPTANIAPRRRVCPLSGIYVASVSGIGAQPLAGVASLGTRPTVDGREMLLEVHIFDFDRDIYGRWVAVNFLRKLRDERRFDSVEEMTAQIDTDAETARSFFERPAGIASVPS